MCSVLQHNLFVLINHKIEFIFTEKAIAIIIYDFHSAFICQCVSNFGRVTTWVKGKNAINLSSSLVTCTEKSMHSYNSRLLQWIFVLVVHVITIICLFASTYVIFCFTFLNASLTLPSTACIPSIYDECLALGNYKILTQTWKWLCLT